MFVDDDMATNALNIIAAKKAKLADHFSAYDSASEALEDLERLTQDEFPHYLFVDVNMPELDGHRFMTALKTTTAYNPERTIVVFLTGSLDIKDVVRADDNEVKYYHWKPLKLQDLEELKKLHH